MKKDTCLKGLKRFFLALALLLFLEGSSLAIVEFYVFKDNKSEANHFLSIAKNGDYECLTYETQNYGTKAEEGSCIKISYDPMSYDEYNWSSLSWVISDSEKEKSYNLSGAERLAIWIRGDKGGEVVQFDAGSIFLEGAGLSGSTGVIILTKKWREYSIDMEKLDLSSTTLGFSLTLNKFDNPNGAIFYLDEIKYEFWNSE